MSLTQLSDLTGYEVSLVPRGANKKKKFLVTKEDGESSMKIEKLLEQILKEGLKDEEAMDKIAKAVELNEEESKAFKAIMSIVNADSSPLSRGKLMEALGSMDVEKDGGFGGDNEEEGGEEVEKGGDPEPKKDQEPVDKEDNQTTKGGDMSGKVPVQKEDGSWDLSKVDESLRPSLEVVCKSNENLSKELASQKSTNETLSDRLKAEKDARVLKEFEVKAESYGHLGDDAKNLAKVLKSAHDADPENGKAIEAILKSANAKIEEGKLFEEKGTSVSGISGATAWNKIEKAAEEITNSDHKVSKAEAIDLVMKKHPELYDEYQLEKRRAV